MLMNLVNLLAENETYSNTIIAGKLGVSEDMLTQLLNDLVRFGYVEHIYLSCSINQCKNCASHCSSLNSSGSGNGVGVWMLTEKGRKAAENKIHI